MATVFDGMSTEQQILIGCLIAAACLVVIALLGCFIDLAVNRKTRNQEYEPDYDQDILIRQPGYDSMTPGTHSDSVAELHAGPPIVVVTPPEDYDRSEAGYPTDQTQMARRGQIYDASFQDGSVLRPIRMQDPYMTRIPRQPRGNPISEEVDVYNYDAGNYLGGMAAYPYSRPSVAPPVTRMATYGNHNRWQSGDEADDFEYQFPVPYRTSIQPMRQMAPWQTTMPSRYSLPADIEAQQLNRDMMYVEPYDPIMDDPNNYMGGYIRPAAGHNMASYYNYDPATLTRGDQPQAAFHVSNVQTNRQTMAPWSPALDGNSLPLLRHYPYYQPRAEQIASWQTGQTPYSVMPLSYYNYWQNYAPYLWDQRYRQPVRRRSFDSEGDSDSERSRPDTVRVYDLRSSSKHHKKSKKQHRSGRSRHKKR